MRLLHLREHGVDFPVHLLRETKKAGDKAMQCDLLLILDLCLFALQGYDHVCNDPAMMYRVDTMPGLGW